MNKNFPKRIEIIPLSLPIVNKNDNIANIIISSLESQNMHLENDDIIVIAHTIISRAEGQEFYLPALSSSPIAEIISRKTGKDSNLVQLIIDETKKFLKIKNNIIISQHNLGWISANAAVDQSNAARNCAILLPVEPDMSAKIIGETISRHFNINVSVIISDTHGRALRRGAINVAIGSYNFSVIDDVRGRKDIFGYELKSTIIALADEVCSAAELVMGQAGEGTPVVIIRGFIQRSPVSSIYELLFPEEKRLFQ